VLGTADVGNGVDRDGRHHYHVSSPGDGPLVAAGDLRPAAEPLPKERWLLGQLADPLGRGRNVLVYLRPTGNGAFIARLRRLIRAHLRDRRDLPRRGGRRSPRPWRLDHA